jgi:hypothetical protein
MRKSMSDQASINSYVSQLTGSYSAGGSAVAPVTSAAPSTAPPYPQYGKSNDYDTYNSTGSPPPNNSNAPSDNRYSGSANYQNQQNNGYAGGNNYQGGSGYGGGNNWQSGNAYGGPPANNYGNGNYQNYPPPSQGYRQGRVAYAPAGQVIPVTLATSIATQLTSRRTSTWVIRRYRLARW